jgi:hypothetical protein
VPYSNETLYMKALEYKTYFIHIDCEQILKSLEDIQVFFSIWNTGRMFGQGFGFMWCIDGIWLTQDYNGAFRFKGDKCSVRYLQLKIIKS